MRSIDDLDVGGQTVLLRVDLNVPRDGDRITDDGRIRASLPTITKLASRGARVLACAHLGRPQGSTYAERAAGGPSLRPVAVRLGELLGAEVPLAADVSGPGAAAVAAGLSDGQVGLLENVRFEPAETSKDDAQRGELARRLAGPAQLYVGDGFGALHRKHASVYDAALLLPHAAGELVLAEVEVLRRLTTEPARPYVVVLGGAKPSDKLAVISNLLDIADRLLIGGGMSYTFLAARGYEVGHSLLEADQIPQVAELMAEAERRGVEVVLPVDLVAATGYAAGRGAQGGGGRRLPRRPGEPGHGAGDPGAIRREARRRQDGVLERAGRGIRVPRVRGGHPGGGRRHQPGGGTDGGGRGRLRGSRSAAGFSRYRVLAYLHGRRRQPGIPRRPDAAWPDRS